MKTEKGGFVKSFLFFVPTSMLFTIRSTAIWKGYYSLHNVKFCPIRTRLRTNLKNEIENEAMTGQMFFNEVQASFKLREPKSSKPTNIYLVCRVNKKQVKLSTGVKVYPEHWNVKKQVAYISVQLSELDNRNNLIANDKLAELKANFTQYKEYLCENPNELDKSIELLRKYIYKDTMAKKKQEVNALHWLRDTLAADKTIKESTKMDYAKHIKFFEAFLNETDRYPISFGDINLSLIKDYETYLFNKEVGKGKTTKTTTVGNKVEKMICIIRRAEPYDLIDTHEAKLDKYKKPQSRQGDDNEIYLTEEELDKIYSLELTGTEEQVRDLFVLQCWIGQRFADTQTINEGIIRDTKDGKVLEIVQEKKTHKVTIPLLPIALAVLEKYNGKMPLFTNQTALIYLKRIGEKAGIKRLHNVTEDRGGEVITTKVKAYELIGTHTARRSFICNMLKRGYDSKLIKKITGHSNDESFEKYNKLTSEDAAMVVLSKEGNKSEPVAKPKRTVKLFDYLFAESTLIKLVRLKEDGINIYELKDTREAIATIMNIKRTDDVKSYAATIDKIQLSERINILDAIIWELAKRTCDTTLYQVFQQKVIELELSASIKQVIDGDVLNQLWTQEYANEELERNELGI